MRLASFLSLIITILFFSIKLNSQTTKVFPYQLDEPNEIYKLTRSLAEVSGLSYYGPDQLACLNDEHGRMYVYDISEREIVHSLKFTGSGDFEGIEKVGNDIYAIKSNGFLYRFNQNSMEEVDKIESPFNGNNDIEGLGYDPISGNLLIALKGKGGIGNVNIQGKTIYGFNIHNKTFGASPLYLIKDKDIEKLAGKSKDIKPSGVAVHPISGEIYVIASVGKALVVFNRDGSLKSFSSLKKKLFPQPEGIAFSPSGDLFISNEMNGGGSVLHFKMN